MLMTVCTKRSHVAKQRGGEARASNRQKGTNEERESLSQSHNLTLQAASKKNGHCRHLHNTMWPHGGPSG